MGAERQIEALQFVPVCSFSFGQQGGIPAVTTRTSAVSPRFLIGVLLGASLALIALAVWMIINDEGSPVLVAVVGSMLACGAAIAWSRIEKRS